MPALSRYYTADYDVRPDGSVAFACSQDREEWPWLALPPQHPLVIQTQNFWTSVGAGQASGNRDESKWSALTWTDWKLGDLNAGQAVRGEYFPAHTDDKLAFETDLYDAEGRLIAHIRGKGVVFRTRDFESWRKGSKSKAQKAQSAATDFTYAAREAVGLSAIELPLIAPLTSESDALATSALITKKNGLMPGHPYFSGSGDHVNTPHLAEVARQVASYLCDGEAVTVTAAEMDMHRYIEFGTPFEIAVKQPSDRKVELAVSQLDRSCAKIVLEWA